MPTISPSPSAVPFATRPPGPRVRFPFAGLARAFRRRGHPDGPARRGEGVPAALLGAVLGALALMLPHGVHAQSLDTTLPDAESGVLGEPQRIEADVGADTTLSSIDLYYRFGGETDYRQLPMTSSGTAGIYAASVPTENVVTERLEFHIVAEETGGGVLLKGSAAEPLVRVLERPENLLGDAGEGIAPASDPDDGQRATSGGRKYLYIALGVLAVGALAAAANSDGGSSDDGCAPEGCRLIVTLPTPGGE